MFPSSLPLLTSFFARRSNLSTPFLNDLFSSNPAINLRTYPQCTPSRASLLTGNAAEREGLSHYVLVNGQDLGVESPLLPAYLPAEFEKHLVGKWHLGHAREEYIPTEKGFDTFKGFYLGATDFFSHRSDELCCCNETCGPGRKVTKYKNNATYTDLAGHEGGMEGVYAADYVTRDAISVIEKFSSSSSGPSSPSRLFLEVAFPSTHAGPAGAPQYKPADLGVNPEILSRSELRGQFDAMASNLDANIESIFSSLSQHALLSDSLVVVLSDNGGEPSAGASNYPLRGEKFTYFEGGIRVPAAVVNLPRGRELSGRLGTMRDVLPTIFDALDVAVPEGVEGSSLLLDGGAEEGGPEPKTVLLDPVLSCGAVFSSRYKLVVNGTCGYDRAFGKPSMGGWSKPGDADDADAEVPPGPVPPLLLFDLRADPEERDDLARTHPALLRDLVGAFEERKAEAMLVERQSKARGEQIADVTPGPPEYKIGPTLNINNV